MDLTDFILRSNRSETVEDLTRDFLKLINSFGMERFIMGELSHDSTDQKERHLGILVNYPQEWLDHYVANHYVDYDPVYQAALTARKPYTWAEVEQKRDISDQALQVMREAKECKLYSGIGLSIHQPMGGIIGMGFAGSEKDARCDKDAVSIIHAAANQFFTVFSELQGYGAEDDTVHLTRREREVLLWLARGKSKSEIGDLLQVSESAIKRHCEMIFQKLDANSVAFAVAKALRMGLVKPF